MTDGRKNVPFALPGDDDDDDDDVFSSVEVNRQEAAEKPSEVVFSSQASPSTRTSQALPAVGSGGRNTVAPTPRLTVETSGQPGSRSVDVTGAVFSIGRKATDLDIADEYVSPFHAQIRMRDGAAFLRDTGSRSGVFLRIADDLALEDWDEIAVGTQRFVFRSTWDPPPQHYSPYESRTPAVGGNLPPDPARLIQMYAGGQIGGVWRVWDRVTIGRQKADVCEPDDQWLSMLHATIERRSNKFFIKDANSQHGTFIRVLDSVELIDGDVFMVGRSRIKINYP